MAKILFVNPVIREDDVPRHIPYGIALLSAIAMEKGHLVQVYDANAWRAGDAVLADVLGADDWEVIATGGITTTYGSVKTIVRAARRICPQVPIVLGGGLLTSLPREVMDWLPEVDVGVIGEAFVTFPEILDMIDAGGDDYSKIDGTVSRNADGALALSPARALIDDLDSLPYPAWEHFPLEEVYFPNSRNLKSAAGMLANRRLDINASYGCSLICKFCFHLGLAGDMRYEPDAEGRDNVAFDLPGTHTRTIRYHSPEYIVGMARHVHDTFGVDFIGFLDENLMTVNRSSGGVWLAEICRLWKEMGLQPSRAADGGEDEVWDGVHWSGTSHATLTDPAILKTMGEAGCSHLIYGYESFSPHILKTLGKGSTVKTNIRSFFWTLEAGIRPMPNQIIGFPNEDFESMRQSMAAWKQLGIVVKPFFATPYPGSEWFAVHRQRLEAQYGGDLEKFILDLGDATKITGVISENFNAIELLGLREAMMAFESDKIDQYEAIWRKNHAIPDGAPSTLVKSEKDVSRAAE